MPSVDLICLANSYKEGFRCIAGLRTDWDGWVRPVSDREHGALGQNDYRLPDGSEPEVLDVVRIGLSGPKPLPHQPENWHIDGTPWKLIERPASERYAAVVAGSVSPYPLLFGSKGRSVPVAQFEKRPARESLVLVQPSDVRWRIGFHSSQQHNKARVVFRLKTHKYDLPLTDPSYAAPLLRREAGDYPLAELGIPEDRKILFAISLGEPFEGNCYKLVAGVVVLPPAWEPYF